MSLGSMPRIDRLDLGTVTRVPEWHPEHARFEPFPVFGWLLHHPDGPILVDTGIGLGHHVIDEWYGPRVVPVRDAILAAGADPDALVAVVLSHLHFDHCGQQRALSAPVYVQGAELEAARGAHYTVPEWAEIDGPRLRRVDGDVELVDGIELLLTPGHTPGHQSVAVEAADQRVVIGAQCAFRGDEVRSGEPAATNLHDGSWRDAARESLARIRRLRPAVVALSHDPADVGVP